MNPSPLRRALDDLLQRWVEGGAVSSVVGLVACGEHVLWQSAATAKSVTSTAVELDEHSLFDLSSLTKPVMATLAIILDQRGSLRLDSTLGSTWPGTSPSVSAIRGDDLLRHRSRFQAWYPLYTANSLEAARDLLLEGSLLCSRLGTYSDLGYVLWGLSAERALSKGLWRLLRTELLEPAGLEGVGRGGALAGLDVVPCLCDNGQEVELAKALGIPIGRRVPELGAPQDGNAAFLGGLAGHAGLFGSAAFLHNLANFWLSALRGQNRILRQGSALRALSGPGRGAGWGRRRVRGGAGPALSPSSFGHVGFSGTSLWCDPTTNGVFILLGQRTSPFSDLDSRRRKFHRLAVALLQVENGPL